MVEFLLYQHIQSGKHYEVQKLVIPCIVAVCGVASSFSWALLQRVLQHRVAVSVVILRRTDSAGVPR